MKKQIGITLLGFLMIQFSFAGVNQKVNNQKIIDSGTYKVQMHDYKGAIVDFTNVLESDPENVEVLFLRAEAKQSLDDYFGAIMDYNQILTYRNNSFEAFFQRGKAKSKLMDYRGAIKDFDTALKIAPDEEGVLMERGKAQMALKSYQDSISDFSKILKMDPQNKDAYYLRGLIFIHLGESGKGCEDLSHAGELGDEQAYERIREYCVP